MTLRVRDGAPRSAAPRVRIDRPGLRLLVKIVVLGGGVVAGFVVLPMVWATLFALLGIVNLVLMYVGPLARRSPQARQPQQG